MTVLNVHNDPTALTLTITCEFEASAARLWQVWADPRQLERWWGPPIYPATVEEHDLAEGGKVTYYMTGPTGDTPRGWWRVISVNAPHHLRFEDGFADDAGEPSTELPSTLVDVTLRPLADGRTRMVVVTTFTSTEAMEQIIALGVEEGMTLAMGQIDDLLGEV